MSCYNGDTPEEFMTTDIPDWESVITNPLGLTEFYSGEVPLWDPSLGEFQWKV